MSEIRLDLKINGKKKTFTQDFVPYSKALEYTESEAKLLAKEEKLGINELSLFRAKFVASLFDDEELTGELIIDGLDTENVKAIMDIIMYRVLGYEKPATNDVTAPKGVEEQ